MRRTKSICCLLLTAVMLFCAVSINAATAIGSVLTTDIKAYINGCEVPSYNIDGNMVVIGQDLKNYGFNVVYDNSARTSYISYDGNGSWNPIATSYENSQSIGTKVMDVYQSDISVSVNGNKVACYNVDGKMAFKFAELKVFGNYYYDNETRSSNLWVGTTNADEADTVSVVTSSSAAYDFENIYIDENGNLIFELSNGNVINAGAVLNGKDGRDGQDGESGRNGLNGSDGEDGVSIVNAYVDSDGDLIVELSNHKVINAGNVGSSDSSDKQTFSDYEVGAKFYLTQPTGEFEVTVDVDDVPYTVEFSEIYYELTAKNDFNDENSWKKSNRGAQFIPYEVTVHIDGVTDSILAGREIAITLYDSNNVFCYYSMPIDDNGNFSLSYREDDWISPRRLTFTELTISIVRKTSESDDEEDEIKELISYFAGTWTSPDEPGSVIVLKEDGTIIENDIEYTPSFRYSSNYRLIAEYNNVRASFYKYNNGEYLDMDGNYYYRDGTWLAVPLSTDNFFDYFEYEESFRIIYNAFGEWESAEIGRYYDLKDEYKRLYEYEYGRKTEVAVKVKVDTYYAEYTIDFENRIYTVEALGELYKTENIVTEGGKSGYYNLSLPSTIFKPTDSDYINKYYIFDIIDATGTLYLSINSGK